MRTTTILATIGLAAALTAPAATASPAPPGPGILRPGEYYQLGPVYIMEAWLEHNLATGPAHCQGQHSHWLNGHWAGFDTITCTFKQRSLRDGKLYRRIFRWRTDGHGHERFMCDVNHKLVYCDGK